jgi:hypothetical protein
MSTFQDIRRSRRIQSAAIIFHMNEVASKYYRHEAVKKAVDRASMASGVVVDLSPSDALIPKVLPASNQKAGRFGIVEPAFGYFRRERKMKTKLFVGLGAAFVALAASQAASAGVHVGINVGVPAPVYVAPAPVYVAPPPPPVVYAPAPAVVYGGPAVVIGWHNDRYWDGRRWWGRRDYYYHHPHYRRY